MTVGELMKRSQVKKCCVIYVLRKYVNLGLVKKLNCNEYQLNNEFLLGVTQ